MAGAGEEDPFAEFLSTQGMPAEAGTASAASAAPVPEGAEADPNLQLRLLVECSQRQEQLLGKVCSLLVGLSEKVERISTNQDRLEAQLLSLAQGGAAAAASAGAAPAAARGSQSTRGQMVLPPGQGGAPVQSPLGGAAPAGAGYTGVKAAEDPRLAQERLAAERQRVEEENQRRAEELARKREEDERRRRDEAERARLEEERKKEEERLRKQALEKKTTGLMSDLISGGGGGSLFGDDEPKRPKKGGLFDD